MEKDGLYNYLHFSADYSVDDWNSMINILFSKYFINENIFDENKEVLRMEVINYIKFINKPDIVKVFEWTFDLISYCIKIDKQLSIKILADSFHETSNTDFRWMTNFMTQADSSNFSERDKISYYFKNVDEILEGCFKPRFKLIHKFSYFKMNQSVIDNSNTDFGRLINEFPIHFRNDIQLLLKDPINSISTSQWRNIAAHKSFTVNKAEVVVQYGKATSHTISMSISNFYKTFQWIQDIYGAIRFAQTLIYLNYMPEIVSELGGINKVNIRFEASLLHLVHNMQVVGFEFVATEEEGDIFCLAVKSKLGFDLTSSLIHASQCLDQLCCAIHDDIFIRDNFQKTKISVIDRESNKVASAIMSVEWALKKVYGEISTEEYINNMEYDIKQKS